MLLKNLMEEKQLDFNQPLLSVRRFTSAVSTPEADFKRKTENAFSKVPPPPKYKSELKSGPVRNPGTVPFVWERSPGRPKCESEPQNLALEQPPVIPKLPPGRMLNVERKALNRGPEVTAAGQSETRNGLSGSRNVPSSYKKVIKEERSKDIIEEMKMSASEDGDGDETYVDALDTLSRSESFFLNCSISGVSALDGPDIKPYGTFSTDPQTRDFMMGRFLPAAKAMASEIQHSTKKQPVAREQPRQIKKMISSEKRHQFNECRRSNMPHCSQYNGVEETEEEDDDDYDRPDNSSLKVCGLFPRLCLQNSFCLLNPVPGMSKQAQVPIYLSHMTKVKSSYAACGTETVNVHDKDAVSKERLTDPLQAKGVNEDKSEPKSELNKTLCRNDYQKLDGSSLYKRLQGNGTSPYHDKSSESTVNEEKRSLGIPEISKNSGAGGFNAHAKVGKNFRELLANERNEWESASSSSLVEKTLYIDSVQMIEPQLSKGSSNTKGLIDYRRVDALTNKGTEATAFVDSSPRDNKHDNAASEKMDVVPESLDPTDSSLLSSSNRSMHDVKVILMDGSRHDQDLVAVSVTPASPKVDGEGKIDLESQLGKIINLENSNGIIPDPIKMSRENVAGDGMTDLKSLLCAELRDQGTPNGCYSLRPLPPPLPKSPSESWLKRTLSAISSKHAFLKSSKGQSLDLKWETIVKTSNVQHGHLRFSEELLTPIPEV